MPTTCRLAAALASALLLALFVAPGCGGATVESVCSKCPKNDDSCVKDGNEGQTLAKAVGCGAEAQAVLDCTDDKGTCDSNGELDVEGVCDAEFAALDKCGEKLGG